MKQEHELPRLPMPFRGWGKQSNSWPFLLPSIRQLEVGANVTEDSKELNRMVAKHYKPIRYSEPRYAMLASFRLGDANVESQARGMSGCRSKWFGRSEAISH